MTSALRVASHLADDEDLKGQPQKKYPQAIQEAMKYHRLLRQAEEPDYPETARRRYIEQNERFEKFMADFKRKATKSDDDGRTV
jgi:acyl carrier protein phosphodiesterase